MPWGSWITCEETVNGPDVGPDFTGASNVPLQQRHGFIFEVPAGGQSDRVPITKAGRFAHEAAAFDPRHGHLYLTEDNFGFPSGFYRYVPPSNPMDTGRLEDDGQLQMLAVEGMPNADLAAQQPADARVPRDVGRHRRPRPDVPVHAGPDGADEPTTTPSSTWGRRVSTRVRPASLASRARCSSATSCTSAPRRAVARPSRATSDTVRGWGNGSGQIWAYSTRSSRLSLVYQSPGPDTLDFPDNVTTRGRALVLCEDNVNDNYLRALNAGGRLSNIALNRLVSSTGMPRFNDEFAGATFSPGGETLYVNIQAASGHVVRHLGAVGPPRDLIR